MTEAAIVVVNAAENDHYRLEVAPFKKPMDHELEEENPEVTHKSHSSLKHNSLSHTPFNERPCEEDANKFSHSFALRLGFDTIKNPSSNGFTVGGALACNIKPPGEETKWYVLQDSLPISNGSPNYYDKKTHHSRKNSSK